MEIELSSQQDVQDIVDNQPASISVTLPPNDPAIRTNQIGPVVIERTSIVRSFPNVAFGTVQVAVLREQHGNQKLKALSNEVKRELRTIDTLLNLNSELISLSDKEPIQLTDKIKELLSSLEKENIQLGKELDGKITKQKITELKSQISSHTDKLRTKLQTTISTEIQPEANNLNSIMNIVVQIIQMDGRLKRKTQEIAR